MSHFLKAALFITAFSLIAYLPISSAQEANRTSLGINGCFPAAQSVAAASDGLIVFAGCEGPKGMFYSRDLGQTWTFAGGGSYSAGEGRAIYLTSRYAFMNSDEGSILHTALPASAEAPWSPDWQVLSGVDGYQVYATIGNYLVLYKPGSVAIYNSASTTISDTAVIDDGALQNPQVLKGGNGQYVFMASGLWFASGDENPRTTKLHYVPFDSGTGQFTSDTWTTVNLSEASGIPAGAKNYIQKLEIAPNNRLYLALPQTGGCNQPIYASDDLGQNFSDTSLCSPMRQSSFSAAGQNYLLETYMSRDAGASWTDLLATRPDTSAQHISLDPSTVLIDQSAAADWGLFRSNVGFDRASGLSSGPVEWSRAYQGFEALEMYDLAQSPTNPNRVLISNRAGYAISNNFLSDTPTWVHPYCPNADCYGGRAAAIDLTNPDVFYMGGNPWIYKVQFDFSNSPPTSTATQFIRKPSESTFYGQLYTSSLLPNTLVACYQLVQGGKDGGLYFYDLSDGSELKHALSGTPVNRFIAVSATIMFAAIGADNDNFPEEAYRGLYRSADGGTTWTKVSDPLLAGKTLVNNFAYDTANDILYAVTKDGPSAAAAVVRLKNAASGSQTWESAAGSVPLPVGEGEAELQNINMTAVAVDSTSGALTVAGGRQSGRPKIWVSNDYGDSWSLAYNGLPGEKIHFLDYDTAVQSEGVHAKADPLRLNQGSSTGLYAVRLSGQSSTCRAKLAVEEKCKKAVARGTKCEVTATVRRLSDNKPASGARFLFQRATASAGPWTTIGETFRTNNKGKKTVKRRVKKTYYYQARVISPLSCNSPAKRIKVQKGNKR